MPDKFLSRTLASLSTESLITPFIEEYVQKYDFPKNYTLNPAAYIEEITGYQHKWNDRFHPSRDLFTPEMVLYYAKHPEYGPKITGAPFTTQTLIAMQIGTAVHAMMEACLVDIGLTTKDQCEVYFKEETLGISGLCDIKSLHLPDGRDVLVDVKTCSKIPNKLDPGHRLQVSLYMDLIEDAPKDLGSVLYVEKSYPHNIRDFPMTMDVSGLESLYSRWSRVREAIKANDPSSLEFCCNGLIDKRYNSCPVKDYCKILERTGQVASI